MKISGFFYLKMRRIQKRGYISLSVHAVVIIILAIVILGLGVGFFTGMFGKTSVKLEEIVGNEPEPVMPTTNDIVSLSREKIKTNPGET